jgi:dinuclear metal center YbgI/SA1388 family protein
MILKNILPVLETLAPLATAEDFDNVGLLVGNTEMEISGIMVCHDALEEVIEEAIQKNCNLVVCFHPIWFQGIKKLTGKNYVERSILKAIKNDIAIYAVHTALDNHFTGVNDIMLKALGIEQSKILIPKKQFIYKLITFTIPENKDKLMQALFAAGAGSIGNYIECSFTSEGVGTYKGNEWSSPVIGQKFVRETAKEVKIEVTFEKYLERQVLQALFENHVYEEVAYEIYQLQNELNTTGLGKIGSFEKPIPTKEFLKLVKNTFSASVIKHSKIHQETIQKVAVLGGSGAFAIQAAKAKGADVLVTADLKYHDFYQAENQILLLDIGHYESEIFTKNYMVDFLKKKFTNFAIILSEINTNPVKYY